MRRALQFLPLLALAPLGHFLSSYLEGAGILSLGTSFLIGTASMFLLPWIVAGLFLTVKARWPIRIALFIGALVAQGILFATAIPPGATSEMMGIAHRLRREFPPEQMRECAAALRQKHENGTLVTRQGEKIDRLLMPERAVLIDDSELPTLLRGHFARVFIEPIRDPGQQRVYFSLDQRKGIVCDSRKDVRGFSVCSMADGVHTYRYKRGYEH